MAEEAAQPLEEEDRDKKSPAVAHAFSAPAFSWSLIHSLTAAVATHSGGKESHISVSAPAPAPIDDITHYVKGMPSDPDTFLPGQSQWHLIGTWGLHADLVWGEYTGQGSMVAVMDDGFQYTHWDISANYRTDLDRDSGAGDNDAAPVYTSDNHGTSVIGTIIADDNGTGGVGVAFDAQGYGVRIDFQTGTIAQTIAGFQHAYSTGFEVMNNSWGYTSPFADTTSINFAGSDFIDIVNVFRDIVEDGRGGLGGNIVFAAGNSRVEGDNVNYHNMQNSPYVITVAAMDPDGTYSSFSTPGAAILVAAGGTSVWVPDRMGSSGYAGGDYTNFSGTSAAAPIVSGAIAVILEANPELGWRDVQQILAYSAQHNDAGGGSWQYNGAENWNGGGLHFSHDYGFGAVDLRDAVRLAETWELQQTSSNMTTLSPIVNTTDVTLNATGTFTSAINVASNIEIERVIVDLNISHARAGDLIVTLISPDGTESILINRPPANEVSGAFTSIYGFSGIDFVTTSNAHRGESSAGTWTLRIQDATSGNAGTLNDWSISFVGKAQSADDLYVYTDDYGAFSGGALTGRATLTDTGGTDTINLAAVTSGTTLNMNGGTNSTVAGNTLTIASGTVIERAYLGDGNDTVTGNAANNMIHGGRGDDLIIGSAGNDTINGGAGSDTLQYLETIANFTFNFLNSLTVEISHLGTIWMDTVTAIETFLFSDGTYTFSELNAFSNGGLGPAINGTASNETLNGTIRGETINAGAGNDRIYGKAGNDTIYGDTGNDFLYGDDGNDIINGGAGDDSLYGGNGDDTFILSTGNDQHWGNAGIDTLVVNANSTGFMIYRVNASYITLQDTNGVFGTSRIYNDVEFIEFNDVTIDLSVTTFTLNGAVWGTPAAVYGTAAANTMQGTNASDMMYGGAGNDTLYGKAGNDTLHGEDGADRLYGDAGDDILYGNAGDDMFYGGDGNDRMTGGTGNDSIFGNAGSDTAIYASGISDFLIYRDNASYITVRDKTGLLGTDRVYNDVEFLEFGDVTIDLLVTTFSLNGNVMGTAPAINGTSGNDTLNGDATNNMISGGDGNDRIYGKAGNDELNGDAGNDYLYGDAGDDILKGGAGNDFLYGGDGNDLLNGGTGNDLIDGGAGTDTLEISANSAGFIIYRTNASYITVVDTNGFFGTKTVYNSVENLQFTDITIDLTTTTFALNGAGWGSAIAVDGTAANQTMNGTAAHDTLNGLDGNDTLNGRFGNDRLNGGNGNDKLYGNEGDDILIGGAGADALYGGAGNDTFIFDSLGTGVDTVFDYGAGDRFDIADLLSGYTAGVSDISQFLRVAQTSAGTTFSVSATGTGAGYVHAFTVAGSALSGRTGDDLLSAGILITA